MISLNHMSNCDLYKSIYTTLYVNRDPLMHNQMSVKLSSILMLLSVLYAADAATRNQYVRRYVPKDKDSTAFYVIRQTNYVAVLFMQPTGQYACNNDYEELYTTPFNTLSNHEAQRFLERNTFIIKQCLRETRLNRSKRSNPILNRIFPGTKWCGVGNIAANDSDYGEEIETDRCCQAHDKCKGPIRKGEQKLNFKNSVGYSVSPCSCDDTFYLCLKDADTVVAGRIGTWFFNNVNMRCYEIEMVKTCVSWYIIAVWCKKYEYRQGIQLYNGQSWD